MKIAILGPTASGKSRLASRIAQVIQGTVVNGDPFQAYRSLPIGTGQPTPEERGDTPHLGYGTLELDQPLNPDSFAFLVEQSLSEALHSVLVTGSGLYLRGIWHQLSHLPPVPAALTDKTRRWGACLSPPVMHRFLQAIDPTRASQLHSNDSARIQRALALHLASGQRPSDLLDGIKSGVPEGWRALLVLPAREKQRMRVAKRVFAMINAGWEQEVHRVVREGHESALRTIRPLGYLEWLDGPDKAAIPQVLIKQTQAYAKRQCTFFRNQWPEIPTWDPDAEPWESALLKLGLS